MSKITFRADEDLVERIEARDTSKSEIMREALREYLDGSDREERAGRERRADPDSRTDDERPAGRSSTRRESGPEADRPRRRRTDSLDDLLVERVDELVAERLAAWEARERRRADDRDSGRPQDVNVNVTLDTDRSARTADAVAHRVRASDASSDEPDELPGENETTCGQCGESLSDDHVYCPNCGEKAARRLFCECGDEVRSDWGFCPSCGRRTPTADVLDGS